MKYFKKNPRARGVLKQAIKAQKGEMDRAQLLGVFLTNVNRDKAEVPYIRDYFLNDPSDYVRVVAGGYLGLFGDKSGVALCKEILEREPVDGKVQMLQMRAAIAAGTIGDPQLLPILKKVVSSEEYGIAQPHALYAVRDIELGMHSSKTAKLTYIRQALADRYSGRWAANVLRNMKDKEADVLLEWGYSQPEIARNMR